MRADATGCVFHGTRGTTADSPGYVSYERLPLAYAVSRSGSYQALVPKS